MPPAPSFRSRIAATAAVLGLLLGIGCSGKKSSIQQPGIATGVIQGNVTYLRVPVAKDVSGTPTGLDTNPADYLTLPARGLAVRAYQFDTASTQWFVRQIVYTDATGHFTMTVPAGDNYTIQIESFTQPYLGSLVNVIADPNGLSSTLPQAQRPRYFLRASPAGVAATVGTPAPVASVALNGSYTVNFAANLSTTWQIGRTDLSIGGVAPQFTSAAFESTPTGSRVLAILDDTYAFSVAYGNPTPGNSLDLHYLKGRSEPQGTYIQYNRSAWIQPGPGGLDLAYDATTGTEHYFGSIQGGANDDAWDQAVLYTLFGHAAVYRQLTNLQYATYPYQLPPIQSPIDGLSPDLALEEGLPRIMAANLLKSPYLPDTDGSSALLSLNDIRDLSSVAMADEGPYSPRTLAAALWEIALKANGITSPGTATNWATMNPAAITRLFTLSGPAAGVNGPANIYLQLALLKNAKATAEPVDLAAIFTDTVINTVASPFSLPWPQPSTTLFQQAWTTSAVNGPYSYNGTLSMSADHLVSGVYPNASYKEIAYLGVPQASDQTYHMTLLTTPSVLPAGATIQVTVFAASNTQAFTFTGSNATPISFTLTGNGSTTTPAQYPIRVRLLSPTTLQADIPFTLQLAPAPPGTLRGPVLSN